MGLSHKNPKRCQEKVYPRERSENYMRTVSSYFSPLPTSRERIVKQMLLLNIMGMLLKELDERVWIGVKFTWEGNLIVNCYKRKWDVLERQKYRGLILTDQILEIVVRTINKLIKLHMDIDVMQFGFMHIIFVLRHFYFEDKFCFAFKELEIIVLRQLLAKKVYFVFQNLVKAFD